MANLERGVIMLAMEFYLTLGLHYILKKFVKLRNISETMGRGTGGHWGTVSPHFFENKKMRPFFFRSVPFLTPNNASY